VLDVEVVWGAPVVDRIVMKVVLQKGAAGGGFLAVRELSDEAAKGCYPPDRLRPPAAMTEA
jgi:hypothetical protein